MSIKKNSRTRQDSKKPVSSKKVYTTPKIVKHGDLKSLTKMTVGSVDDGVYMLQS